MGRPALQPDEINEFRERLCEAALRLFAEHGYDGFTLRALGSALACSPTTPYRYFENKAEIYDAVCARAFEDLCEAQAAGRAGADTPWEGIRAQGRSYVGFARAHPHAYRVMFDLRADDKPRAFAKKGRHVEPIMRSWRLLSSAFETAADAGELEGDPRRLALSFWSSLHGVLSLELAGCLFEDVAADDLVADVFERFERTYRSRPPTRDPGESP